MLAERKEGVGEPHQTLVFIGVELDEAELWAALDGCLLTTPEFTAGSAAWLNFDDPLPCWDVALPDE